jgi:hypothetical protein
MVIYDSANAGIGDRTVPGLNDTPPGVTVTGGYDSGILLNDMAHQI